MVLVLGNIFKQLLELLVKNDTPLELILSFLAYILPFSLTFTIPWGFLTAVLLVFGKMSAENELIALRANGVSIPRICLPVLALSVRLRGDLLLDQYRCRAASADQDEGGALQHRHQQSRSRCLAATRSSTIFPARKSTWNAIGRGAFQSSRLRDERRVRAHESDLRAARPAGDGQEKKELLMHLFDARYEQRDDAGAGNLMKIRRASPCRRTRWRSPWRSCTNKKNKGISSMTAGELLERLNNEEKPAPHDRKGDG